MLYQGDAHHYRKVIKRNHRIARIKGICLITVSAALAFYAIPAFATSVFDYDDQAGVSAIAFSGNVSDHASDQAVSAAATDTSAAAAHSGTDAVAGAAAGAYVRSASSAVSDTTGPGLLDDDAAVTSAKTRARAMEIVGAGNTSMVYAQLPGENAAAAAPQGDLPMACISMALSLVCAFFGFRSILHDRFMRGRQITAEYSHALRAS